MAKAKVWSILRLKQFRYVVVEFDQNHYLVDLDIRSCWIGYFLPIFNWMISHKVMKINLSEEKVNNLLLNKELSERRRVLSSSFYAGISILGASFLGPILESLFENWESGFAVYTNYSLIFLLLIILLLIKFHSAKNATKVLDLIGKENLSELNAQLYPMSFKQGFKILVATLFAIFLMVGFFVAFIISNLWFGYILGSVFFFGLLMLNEFKIGVPDGFKMKVLS